jgi:hypothetical protein
MATANVHGPHAPSGQLIVAQAADDLKNEIRRGIGGSGVVDVAFKGGLSDVYEFRPAMNLDLDFFVLVARRDQVVGSWLLSLREGLMRRHPAIPMACDVRVVRGPIKHVPSTLDRLSITLHPAVFTEAEYQNMSPVLRWGWRKYRCEVEPGRLRRWAPSTRPGLADLLQSRGGLLRTIEHLRAGRVSLKEWVLPAFDEINNDVVEPEPLFSEYCISKVAAISRNHARCMGYDEADSLDNKNFAVWYFDEVLASPEFQSVMQAKEDIRIRGYGVADPNLKVLAIRYLSAVLASCDRQYPRSG